MDRTQRVGAADRPVAARGQAGTGASQVAEDVLPSRPLGTDERDRELVHLRLVRGPQALHVGGDAERGEARHVIWMHDLEVGDVMPVGRCDRRSRFAMRPLDGVQRLPDGPVTDGVEVHLEAERVKRVTYSRSASGST